MIDSADSEASRGYNFKGVVRWFGASRPYYALDPERPGTTAETLEVYTSALSDFDHKLQVVFNKVDRFQAVRLCPLLWKLMLEPWKSDADERSPQIYATLFRVLSQSRQLFLWVSL